MEAELEEPTPIPLVTNTIKLTLDAKEGKKYSWVVGGTQIVVDIPRAKNPTVYVSVDNKPVSVNECVTKDKEGNVIDTEGYLGNETGTKKGCVINVPVGPKDVPIKLSADYLVPCKTSVQYESAFSYDYNVTGVSYFKFKNKDYQGEAIKTPDPTSSPGPLKFSVEPYTDVYTVYPNLRQVRVTLTLNNEGEKDSQINIHNILLDQISPQGYNNLIFDECIEAYPKGGKTDTPLELVSDLSSTIYPGEGNSVSFHCTFSVENSSIENVQQSIYYTLLATANYTYLHKIKGDTIFPDPRYSCVVSAKNWKMFECSGNEVTSCIQQLTDSKWNSVEYDDSLWSNVRLPDTAWGCDSCDRFYRSSFIVYDPTKDVKLNVASDDGASCWISERIKGQATPKITEIFNNLNDEHKLGEGNSIGCAANSGYNYCFDLKKNPKIDPNTRNYIIGCQVHNIAGDSGFNVAS